jgi:hypothetical protein
MKWIEQRNHLDFDGIVGTGDYWYRIIRVSLSLESHIIIIW